jgi:hypothetical protein
MTNDEVHAVARLSAKRPPDGGRFPAGEPRTMQTAYATLPGRWPDNLTASIGLAGSLYLQGALKEAESVAATAHATREFIAQRKAMNK